MRIALAQINPVIGCLKKNREKIETFLLKARQEGAHCVVFPEMALCGYPPEDLLTLPSFVNAVEEELISLTALTKGLCVIVGGIRRNPTGREKPLFNTAAIFCDGSLLGFQDKSLLPTYDVFTERRFFEPATQLRPWNLWGRRVGITICEDIWQHAQEVKYSDYSIDPVMILKKKKIDLLINISASPFYQGRQAVRAHVVLKAAKTLDSPVIFCNMVGGNDGLIFDGTSLFVDKRGVLGQAASFKEDLLVIEIEKKSEPIEIPSPHISDLYKALILGTRDYFHKQGFQKAILGLSGGIDSAVVACIAQEALSKENLLALMLPSRFTSQESMRDARSLAERLGIDFKEISIEKPYETFLSLLAPYFEKKPFDTTEENLQARIRGMILMGFANKFGYIALNTSNKSESALGYTTLYGDMIGGLSVLGDVSKGNVYRLAEWINRKEEIIPQHSLLRPPSAELREGQQDSHHLPPYDLLDQVVSGYVEEHLSPEDIAIRYDLDLSLVKEIVRKIHLNEHKRRQAPLALRVTKKSFSLGRYFPIVSHWNI